MLACEKTTAGKGRESVSGEIYEKNISRRLQTTQSFILNRRLTMLLQTIFMLSATVFFGYLEGKRKEMALLL